MENTPYDRMKESDKDVHSMESTPSAAALEAATALPSVQMMETGQIIMHSTANLVDTDAEVKNVVFNDETIRKGFIRKVYLLLVTQLALTCGIISIFVLHEPTKLFVQKNPVVLLVAVILNLIVLFSLACCKSARRNFPINLVCLGLFTTTMSILLGVISSRYDVSVVLLAVGITAILVIALSVFAMQTKYDFTTWGGVLVCVLFCIIIIGFAAVFWQNKLLYTVYASCGALVSCFFILYDTQLIIGGKHKYQFSPEEYIFATLTLYVDIVRMFLYILRIMRGLK